MKMEVQIISKETVKPSSSATNSHPKIFKHSVLDQLISARYAPLVLFYPVNKDGANTNVCTKLNLLKTSLSEMLAGFYPLAGKIQDDISIDCNDEGACFVEARVNCTLEEFLTEPDLWSLNRFLPCEFISDESLVGTFVTNVQVSVFKCDGIAVGICVSHRIMGGDGLRMFLQGWSGTKSGEPNLAVSGSLFPASDDDLWLRDSTNATWGRITKKGSCRTKRFVFDASAIAKLKGEAIESGISCPTRVEVVSAILWKSMAAASADLKGFRQPSLLNHVVNLRSRFNKPSLAETSLGNFLWIAPAIHDQTEPKFGDLAGKIKDAIARIDNEFVEKIKGEDGKSVMLESLKAATEIGSEKGVNYYSFSSWCNFRYYDAADFGWGKPIWVSGISFASSVFFNLVILNDTICGEGVEAWVTLDEQEMAILEKNPDIIKLASLDPSPLVNGTKKIKIK